MSIHGTPIYLCRNSLATTIKPEKAVWHGSSCSSWWTALLSECSLWVRPHSEKSSKWITIIVVWKRGKIFDCIKYFNGKYHFVWHASGLCVHCVCVCSCTFIRCDMVDWMSFECYTQHENWADCRISNIQHNICDSVFIEHKARTKISVSFEINTQFCCCCCWVLCRSNKWHTHISNIEYATLKDCHKRGAWRGPTRMG